MQKSMDYECRAEETPLHGRPRPHVGLRVLNEVTPRLSDAK